MFNLLSAAIHGSMLILTASTIGVLSPLFEFQNAPASLNQVSTQISAQLMQNKFLPEVRLSMDEVVATTSVKSSAKEIIPVQLSLPSKSKSIFEKPLILYQNIIQVPNAQYH